MSKYGILVDTTLCIGCYACEAACAERWGFPNSDVHEMSSLKNTAVQQWNDVYVPRLCMHCNEPSCASVCPVGAFTKTAAGPVIYDESKCMGCRYCMQACPFQVPKYQWNSANPKVQKCDMCYDRISKGQKTACVEACPVNARTFGERDVIIKEAYKRIQEKPDGYYNGVYGVTEAGGTSILYLTSPAHAGFENLGLPTDLPKHPLPQLTWNVMSKIPNYVFWGGTLMTGIWWITNRRKEVAKVEKELAEKNNGSNHK